MKGWVFVMLVASLLTACEPAPPGEEEAVGDSPIASFDKTRLWILVKAARVGDGRKCADYYRTPDDVRYKGLAQTCEAWSLNFADYLKLNGLPTVEAAHLRDLIYWDWFEQTKQRVADCRKGLGTLTGKTNEQQRVAHREARNACDPYDDARKNKKQTPEDLGIRFTGK